MLTVNDLMTIDPYTITLDTPLSQIIRMFKRENIRQLPVLEDNKLIGLITDRDLRLLLNSPMLLDEMVINEASIMHFTAESCMTRHPLTVTPDTPIWQAAEMLSIYKFGALPVVDDGILVGIISVTDLLDYMARQLKE